MRKGFDPHACIPLLNNAKRAMELRNTPFTKKSLIRTFKGCGLPTNGTFWHIFRNSGVIKQVNKGLYVFASENPIYEGVLASIKRKYSEYTKNHKNKPDKEEVVEESTEETTVEVIQPVKTDKIQEAIDLLKQNGYIVLSISGIKLTQV